MSENVKVFACSKEFPDVKTVLGQDAQNMYVVYTAHQLDLPLAPITPFSACRLIAVLGNLWCNPGLPICCIAVVCICMHLLMVCVGTVSLLSWDYLQPGARKIKYIKVYMSKGEGVTAKTPRNMVCSWQHWCGDPLFCCVTYVDHLTLS